MPYGKGIALPLFLLLGSVALVISMSLASSHGDDAPDIEVSRDEGPENFDQQQPSVALRGDGSFVVVWSDTRNGDSDIYCQIRNSSGDGLGEGFLVNDDNTGAEQKFPRVAATEDGSFAVSWMDKRDGNWDIYLQMYERSGKSIGKNLLVNDDRSSAQQLYPDLSTHPDGVIEVRWTDWRGRKVRVYRQRYGNNGRELGKNVSDKEAQAHRPFEPAKSYNSKGYSVTAWSEGYGLNSDIYCQIRNASGEPVGQTFKVNDDHLSSEQSFPDVSMAEDRSFVIVWMDKRNSPYDYDIYCQLYDSSGNPAGVNFRASDEGSGTNQISPGIDVAPDGVYVIVWSEYVRGNYTIKFRKLDGEGATASGGEIRGESGYRGFPDVSLCGDGSFLISWDSDEEGDYDVYYQRFSPAGEPSVGRLKVNDDGSDAPQAKAVSAVTPDGKSLVCWMDERERLDIYCQLYDSSGGPVGGNHLAFGGTDDLEPHEVSVAAQDDAGFSLAVRTGCDCSAEDNGIYLIRNYIPGGEPGPAIKVNDNKNPSNRMWVDLGISGDGSTVVCWADRRSGDWDIYCQRFDRFGKPLGENFRVDDKRKGSDQKNPRIAVAYDGSFSIAWMDYRNGTSNPDIYARIYKSDGKPLGKSFRVNTDDGLREQLYPDVGADSSGNFYFVWQDSRTPGHGYDIRMRELSIESFR